MYMMYDMVVKFSFERKLCDGFWFLLNEIIYIYKFSLINFYWEPVEMKNKLSDMNIKLLTKLNSFISNA